MTPTISTIEKVRNYQGQNSFVIKMKDAVSKYGGLTPKQLAAVEKCLNAVATVKTEEMTEDIKRIVDYKGENTFVKDIAAKFQKYGTLTEKQKSAALTQIQKEETKNATVKTNIPVEGDTIIVGRAIGQKMKEEYDLQFNPTLLDITKVIAVSPKAVKFVGKMTVKRGNICVCCGRELTDEFSMLTKMGKTCAKHMKVEYIKDSSEVERFRNEYLKRVEEIGEMEFWVPKRQIKKWEGNGDLLLQMI